MPLTASGVTWIPVAPVSKVQAVCSFATFAGVICFSGEERWPPGSWACDGQSFTSADSAATTAAHVTATAASLRARIRSALVRRQHVRSRSGVPRRHEDTKTRRILVFSKQEFFLLRALVAAPHLCTQYVNSR